MLDIYPRDSVVRRLIDSVEKKYISSSTMPSDIRSRLYYEAHITVRPPINEKVDVLDRLCTVHKWRLSTFAMLKPDGGYPNAFLSYRDARLVAIGNAVASMCDVLALNQFEVLRWKVEDTLFDSNNGDVM